MIGARHFNHAPSLSLQSRPAVFSAVPWNRPRMAICMLTEVMYRADYMRTSVADCLGPLLFKLQYENAESKRQIMEPGAREQTECLIFSFFLPLPLEETINETKNVPYLQSSPATPRPYHKISAHEMMLFPNCFLS